LIEFISLLPLPWLFGHYLCGGDADHPGALLCLQSASGVNAPKGGHRRVRISTGKSVALPRTEADFAALRRTYGSRF
jgi:hypothetical protein